MFVSAFFRYGDPITSSAFAFNRSVIYSCIPRSEHIYEPSRIIIVNVKLLRNPELGEVWGRKTPFETIPSRKSLTPHDENYR